MPNYKDNKKINNINNIIQMFIKSNNQDLKQYNKIIKVFKKWGSKNKNKFWIKEKTDIIYQWIFNKYKILKMII